MDRIAQLQELLKDEPHDNFLRHALALEYIKRSNDLQAMEEFRQLLLHDPTYVGSYYHLAKLYERLGNDDLAIATYEQGMQMARQQDNHHAVGELRSALDELTM